MLICNANWVENCLYTYPIWAKWSLEFSTPKLQFLELNVQNFEALAKTLKVYNMSVAGQLPCLILFEDGKEKLRFPPIESNG